MNNYNSIRAINLVFGNDLWLETLIMGLICHQINNFSYICTLKTIMNLDTSL